MVENEKTISDKILLRRYHEQGDLQAREQLIERHMPLVRSVARGYLNRGEQLDDLVQIGAVGLIKAIDRFDPSRGYELTTYVYPTVRGEIMRHFRDHGSSAHVQRSIQELSNRLSKLTEQLTLQLSRSPTISELVTAAETDKNDVLEALASRRAHYTLSLAPGANQDDDELAPLEALGTIEHGYDVSEDRAQLQLGLPSARQPRTHDPLPTLL
jgi:RNA polymerase sigma-B factor